MILIGIDDTDMPGTPGTNQLARAIVRELESDWRPVWIVRHQLLKDPRVPFTSQNGSASIALQARTPSTGVDGVGPRRRELAATCRRVMLGWYVPGSDPGLCIAAAEEISAAVIAFGRVCQQEVVARIAAVELARREGLYLEGLGGTHGGVIGALAAIGLAREEDDGRIVQWRQWPDDLSGEQPMERLTERDIVVRCHETETDLRVGSVDVGKRLRPNLRGGSAVLFVQPVANAVDQFAAVKLP